MPGRCLADLFQIVKRTKLWCGGQTGALHDLRV